LSKAKFGSFDLTEAKRLTDENSRLKRIPAEARGNNAALKDISVLRRADFTVLILSDR
jgi:hypothetical protein